MKAIVMTTLFTLPPLLVFLLTVVDLILLFQETFLRRARK
jgi:hypothetical protein